MSEEKLWVGKPSQWTNLGHWLLSVVTLGLWLPIAIWKCLELRCTEYALSSQRLAIKRGVLSRLEDDVELYRVKDTRLEQPLLLRLVGLGNIILVTSDPLQPSVVVRAVADPKTVREQLRAATERRRQQMGVREIDTV